MHGVHGRYNKFNANNRWKLSNVQLTVMCSDLLYRNNTVLRILLEYRVLRFFRFFFFSQLGLKIPNNQFLAILKCSKIDSTICTTKISTNSHWDDFAKQIMTCSHHRDDYYKIG